MSSSPKHKPTFTELFAPRHEGLDQFKTLTAPPVFSGTIEPEKVRERSLEGTLQEAYGIPWTTLQQDIQQRPDHYTEREVAIVSSRVGTGQAPAGVRTEEINEIVLKYTEPTKNREVRQQIVRKATDVADDPYTIIGDAKGRMQGPSFQDQNYGSDLKKII